MATLVISILALVAGVLSAFYGYGQLQEAKRVREEIRNLAGEQQREDDLWAEKFVKAGKLLCRMADMDGLGMVFGPQRTVYFPGGSLGMLFGEDVHKHILGLLIEQNGDRTYSLRPLDTPQLRLKTNRDLIDLVLTTIDKFQREKPEKAKESGL
jgi:hypothetical protein